MKKIIASLVVFSCCFLSFSALKINAACIKNNNHCFEIVSTTDMHGRATTKNVATGKVEVNSMERVATVVQKERSKFGKKLILVDNGDLIQGTLLAQYAITVKKDKENPMLTAIKYMGYDVWVMGNHEFNYLPEQRDSQIIRALDDDIAVLGGNIVLKQEGKNIHGKTVAKGGSFYDPFFIKTIKFSDGKSVRVAIIGLGNANNANWDRECNYPNLQFSSIDNPDGFLDLEINKWVKYLKEKDLADIIVVSAHSGKTTDDGVQTTKFNKESQAVYAAKKTSGFDMMIYGHDHSPNIELVKNADGKEIYLVNGGCSTVTRSVFDVKFDKNGKYLSSTIKSDAVKLADVKEDKKLAKILQPWYDDTYAWASAPLGSFEGGWDKITAQTKGKTNNDLVLSQTEISNFIHKVQLWASWQNFEKKGIKGATVSMTSSALSTNPDGTVVFVPTDGRKISTLELSLIYMYANNILCTVDMTPKQLYSWMNAIADKLMIDANGNPKIKPDQALHGTDTFYGIDYVFDLTKPEGQRVSSAKINGVNLLDIKTPIRVVLNTYRISGAHGFFDATGLKESDCVWESTDFLSEENASIQALLGQYVHNAGQITPKDKPKYGYDSVWKIITK